MNNILTEYGAMVWLAWYGSETVPPTDTSVLKKHVLLFLCLQKNMFSCSHVLKKHVLLSSCLQKKTCYLVLMSSKKTCSHVLMSSCLKNKNMFSCSHVLKKHVLLSNRGLAWYGSETVPPTILVI